jgi:hypothetical protein
MASVWLARTRIKAQDLDNSYVAESHSKEFQSSVLKHALL